MALATFPPRQWPITSDTQANDEWYSYFAALDRVLRTGTFGPLVNAANDVAAAAAGVPINGIYRNGSQVNVRVS